MKALCKYLLGSTVLLASGSAFAAVPVVVTDAITEAGVDAVALAAGIMVVMVLIFAVALMRRNIK